MRLFDTRLYSRRMMRPPPSWLSFGVVVEHWRQCRYTYCPINVAVDRSYEICFYSMEDYIA